MFSSPIYYIVLSVVLLILIILLVRIIIQRRKEDKIFREYMAKMDELRKKKQAEKQESNPKEYRTYREKKEAERRAPANPLNKTYYTTYNEREEEYIPKYAAGDDMDQIHHPQMPERMIPDWMIYVIIIILAILLHKNGIQIWTF